MKSHASVVLTIVAAGCLGIAAAVSLNSADPVAQRTYVGQEACMGCHAGAFSTTSDYQGASAFRATLHQKNHFRPSPETVVIEHYFAGDSVLRFVIPQAPIPGQDTLLIQLSKEGTDYFAQMRVSGVDTTPRFKVEYVFGGHGWIERYLVLVGDSYYVLPFQYVLPAYRDRNPNEGAFYYLDLQRWLGIESGLPLFLPANSDEFKAFAYDRECAGCHVNGFDVRRAIDGIDTTYVADWVGKSQDSALQDQNIRVGCEVCHGPGSDHVANPIGSATIYNPRRLGTTAEAWRLKIDLCNYCHARARSTRETFRYPYDEEGARPFIPGQPLENFVYDMFSNMNNWPDGRTSYAHRQVGQDYLRSEAHHGVFPNSCYDCHSVHTQGMAGMPYQLREDFYSLTDGVGCLRCHGSAGPSMNPPLDDMSRTALRHGRTVNAHTQHSLEVSRCVNCHMTLTASIAFIQLQRKPLYEMALHSFRVIPPVATINLQESLIGMINTCSGSCHRNGRGSRNLIDTLPRAPDFGITDAHLGTWKERSDVALADSLWRHYQVMFARYMSVRTGDAEGNVAGISLVAPVPFSESTTVSYQVARSSDVAVEVYEFAGRRVRTLAAGSHARGTYRTHWDGTDDSGMLLGAGSYLIRMRGQGVSSSRVVQLVR